MLEHVPAVLPVYMLRLHDEYPNGLSRLWYCWLCVPECIILSYVLSLNQHNTSKQVANV